jgi:PadR family transcriptional regulator, regulatory protein PadR
VRADALKGHLDGLLLAIVAEEQAHGYAIVERLRARSGGAFALPEGTVYPALHRLERAGMLASAWTVARGRRRRVYRITKRGRATLARSRDEWRSFAHAVEAVLA